MDFAALSALVSQMGQAPGGQAVEESRVVVLAQCWNTVHAFSHAGVH
jgi:hypothetical protein